MGSNCWKQLGCMFSFTDFFFHGSPLFQFITWQQMKILQMAILDHGTVLENAKDMCDTFLKVW